MILSPCLGLNNLNFFFFGIRWLKHNYCLTCLHFGYICKVKQITNHLKILPSTGKITTISKQYRLSTVFSVDFFVKKLFRLVTLLVLIYVLIFINDFTNSIRSQLIYTDDTIIYSCLISSINSKCQLMSQTSFILLLTEKRGGLLIITPPKLTTLY